MHEALFDDRSLRDNGVTTLDLAKAAHRRGIASNDRLFPSGRPWRDASGTDRDGNPGQPRPLHRHHAGARQSGPRQAMDSAKHRFTHHVVASTKPARPASPVAALAACEQRSTSGIMGQGVRQGFPKLLLVERDGLGGAIPGGLNCQAVRAAESVPTYRRGGTPQMKRTVASERRPKAAREIASNGCSPVQGTGRTT